MAEVEGAAAPAVPADEYAASDASYIAAPSISAGQTGASAGPVLVLGASGLLGRAVHSALAQAGHQVIGTACSRANKDLEAVDLTADASEDEGRWSFPHLTKLLDRTAPSVIVNCVAERRPEKVQSDPEAAEALNVEMPRAIAQWCASRVSDDHAKTPLHIHISTDYVFDGTSPPYTPSSPTNPLNAYGLSKVRAEHFVTQEGPEGRIVIVRVPILYGRVERPDESAVSVLLDAVRLPRPEGELGKDVDANQTRYPTCVEDVAKAIRDVIQLPSVPPILHVSAQEAMTKYIMSIVLARVWNSARTRAWNEAPSPVVDPEYEEEDDGPAASSEHLTPLYDADPFAATSRPLNARLDVSATARLGITTECIEFDTWWGDYLFEQEKVRVEHLIKGRAEVAEARKRVRIEEAERKIKEEEERFSRETAEAVAAEERRQREAAEAEERLKTEAAEAEERLKREEAEAEEHLKQERTEAEEQRKKEKAKAEAEASTAEEHRENEDIEAEEQHKKSDSEAADWRHNRDAGAEEKGEQAERVSEGQYVETGEAEFRDQQLMPTEVATKSNVESLPALNGSSVSDGAGLAAELSNAADAVTAAAAVKALRELVPPPSTIETHAPASPLEEPEKVAHTPSRIHALSPDPSFNSLTAHPTPPESSPLVTPREGDDEDDPKDDAPLGSLIGRGPAQLQTPSMRPSTSENPDSDSERYGAPSPRPSRAPTAPGLDRLQVSEGASPPAVPPSILGASTASHATAISGHDGKSLKAWFEIKVGDPQTVGAPMAAHTVYTVRTRTDSERFRSLQFSVLRRYRDFRWLHAALVHNHPGVIVPPVPEKVKIGRFNPELVEARRVGLELCINKIANHAVLQKDDDFALFLSSDNFSADVHARDLIKGPVPTPEQRTYLGWGTSLVSAAGAGGPRFHETDEWFDKQRAYLDSLETHLKTIVKAVHTLSEQRRVRAKAEQDLAKYYAALSTSSLSRATCTCFAGVGEATAVVGRCSDVQAEADVRDLGAIMYEYERMVGSVRKAFQTREDAWVAWKRSADELAKIVSKHDKLREEGAGHIDRRDLVEKEAETLHLQNRFDAISRTCKSEMASFDHDRIVDIRGAVATWIQGMIHRQQEMVREWEEYAALVQRQTGSNHTHKPNPAQAPAVPAAIVPTDAHAPVTAPVPTQAQEEAQVQTQSIPTPGQAVPQAPKEEATLAQNEPMSKPESNSTAGGPVTGISPAIAEAPSQPPQAQTQAAGPATTDEATGSIKVPSAGEPVMSTEAGPAEELIASAKAESVEEPIRSVKVLPAQGPLPHTSGPETQPGEVNHATVAPFLSAIDASQPSAEASLPTEPILAPEATDRSISEAKVSTEGNGVPTEQIPAPVADV